MPAAAMRSFTKRRGRIKYLAQGLLWGGAIVAVSGPVWAGRWMKGHQEGDGTPILDFAAAFQAANQMKITQPTDSDPQAIRLHSFLRASCLPNQSAFNFPESYTVQCLNGTLRSFSHIPPNFLPHSDDERLFWLQPENNASIRKDWIDWKWETCYNFSSGNKIRGTVIAGGSWSFQHLLDTALGLAVQLRQAMDRLHHMPISCRFDEHLNWQFPQDSQVAFEIWDRLGFSATIKSSALQKDSQRTIHNKIYMTRYPRDAHQMRVGPEHVDFLRQRLFPKNTRPSIQPNKVVWMSRKGAKHGRQLANEDAVLAFLQEQHDLSVTVFNPMDMPNGTVKDLVDLLGNACALIGVHGGQMYNQFFAHDATTIIELMPITERGLLKGQVVNTSSVPKIAHRAIWHNANLIGQPYWRFHIEDERFGFVPMPLNNNTVNGIAEVLLSHADCAHG